MFLSDSLPSEIRFRQAYTLSFYLSVMGRVSPVPNHTFHTYRFPYTEGFFRAAFPVSSHVPWSSFNLPKLDFPFFLKFDLLKTLLTIRQNSLYVTVCMIASTSYQGYFIHSLSTLHYCNAPSLTTRLTGDYRDRTCTGKCGPASLDTRRYRGRTTSLWSVILLGCSTSLAGLYRVPPLRSSTPYSQISFIGYCRYRGRNDLPLVGIPAWHSSRLWLFPPPLTTGQSGVVGSSPTATNSRTDLLS